MKEHFKDLAQKVAEAFYASGARNYYGEVFTIDDGQTNFEIDITIRPVNNPSPHDLRIKAEGRVQELEDQIEHLTNVIQMLSGNQN